MNDRTQSATKMPVSRTMESCDARAMLDRTPAGVRTRGINAPTKPSVAMSAAMCMACLRASSDRATTPRTSNGSPNMAGISAVKLLVPVRKYPASPSSVRSNPNRIVVEAMG